MKRIITLMTLVLAAICAKAENYPHRSDYLWTAIPDHADWLYTTGQKARIEVTLLKYGMPFEGTISYEVADDLAESDIKGSATLKNGRCILEIPGKKTPGFRDIRLLARDGDREYRHHVKIGFSPEKIEPVTVEPADFNEFWENTIAQAREFPLSYTMEPSPEYSTDKIDAYLVKLMVNRSQGIYAYLFFPKERRLGGHPVVLCPPGAGVKTIKEPLRHRYYAERGCIRMEMEIHGLDPRLDASVFSEISAAFNGKDNAYMLNGIDSRERYYLKRVYIALVRSIDLLTSLPEWDGRNVAVQGGSQGGALSIVAAALDSRVTHCIVNHPAVTDMAGLGWPHIDRKLLTKENVRTLSYYDVINFARQLKDTRVYMTWGYNDDTCPPTTSYAAWNVMKCPKESLVTPVNEHWTSEATEEGHCRWLLKNLIGKQED